MKIRITLRCPRCQHDNIVKNDRESYSDKQNYLSKHCARPFIGDQNVDYPGCHRSLGQRVKPMFGRGMGIGHIAAVERISIGNVLSSLSELKVAPQPKQSRYDTLEVDEFWGYVGEKANKVWLIYAYHRGAGKLYPGCLASVITRQPDSYAKRSTHSR